MPELPEVETIVNQLKMNIVGKTITHFDIFDSKMVDQKIKGLIPSKIIDVFRRGKSIIIQIQNDKFILIHLRMTGHFFYLFDSSENNSVENVNKNVVAKFSFNDNSYLTHNSIRRFGSITLLSKKELTEKLSYIGPEPLADNFTSSNFCAIMRKHPRSNLKNKLLDQKTIAGIGNIYAQEALYVVGINPERKIFEITENKLVKLYHSLREILQLSIENKGTTVQNYSHMGGKGNFQNFLKVYNQTLCPLKHKIEKIQISGRGTYYCPVCQK